MRKILFVIPSMRIGGAEKSLVNLLNLIDLNEYDVSLLMFKPEGDFLQQIPSEVHILETEPALFYAYKWDKNMFFCKSGIYSAILRIFSTCVCKILYGNYARQRRWIKFYKPILPKHKGEYDVAIGYLEGDASYYVIDKVNAKRKILWVHSNFDNIKENEEASVYREYFHKADKVVSISDKCVQVLQNNYPDMKRKFVYLPNLTSSVALNNVAKVTICENFSKDNCNIVSVGRLTEAKGFDMAIDALKILKERKVPVHWWIVGDGELRESLEMQMRDNGVEQNLTFLGFKSNPYPYMNNADLIVQTSRWEGKSVVLDEAKILGKTIVVTNYATVNDQILDRKEGIVVDMTPEGIANGIAELLDNKQLRNSIENYLSLHEYGNQREIEMYYKYIDGE